MRLSIDVGGTFTDLVLDDGAGGLSLFKSPTTSPDPIDGVLAAIGLAAEASGLDVAGLLGRTDMLMHSTTRAINAVVTGNTARTALLATEGHPDILLIREGGRADPFNYRIPYPEPYVPRRLTFEVPGRVGADGRIVRPLDEQAVRRLAGPLAEAQVESVAVALIWSIVNPAHEERVGELLAECLPGVPVSLSHRLNPSLREYRRASSCCIDASLKPVMTRYLKELKARLRVAGLAGQIYAVTSQGGLVDIDEMAERPVLALNSGPSMAPVAGRHYAALDDARTAIVTDAGGTTYDVSLVRDGQIPWTRETWIGPVYQGHMTGFPSVDVKSIGAGGGSIAAVQGGLLQVGPASAGSTPGPVCYGRGGTRPTVTDAALVLGYIDPAYFLGGRMALDVAAARQAIAAQVAAPLGLGVEQAALAILDLATESMVNAIEEITVKQGIDPEETVLVGGGGAAGLNAVAIGRRLKCRSVLFPDTGAVLSASGAVMSELRREMARTRFMRSADFDAGQANAILDDLTAEAEAFFAGAGGSVRDAAIDLSIEARYPSQVWEVEVALPVRRFSGPGDVARLVADFHARHTELFSFADDGDEIEIVSWRAVARARVVGQSERYRVLAAPNGQAIARRPMHFHGTGTVEAPAYHLEGLEPGREIAGPAVVESGFTTVVLHPGARAGRAGDGRLVVYPGA